MAPSMFTTPMRVAALLVGLAAFTDAKKFSFFDFQPLSQEDIDAELAIELAGDTSMFRLEAMEKELKPFFKALPKSPDGYLGHQVVRYVLHRFFVQRHGWYIRGFEPNGDSGANLPSGDALKDWIPSYLQGRLEERLGGRGVDLYTLAVLAVTLEDIVRREASHELGEIYRIMELPADKPISRVDAEKAITTYMVVFLMNRNVSMSSADDAATKRRKFTNKYKGWTEAHRWLERIEKEHKDFVSTDKVEFNAMVDVVSDIGEQYSAFNDGECRDLKTTLMGMEHGSGKVGRIRLVDFYNKTLYTHWKFNEKREYLRELGALDESNASQPMVILPNYISAYSNCLRATSVYAVCCRNECEDLMGHIERDIASPTASPTRVMKVVADLPSATVAAPRKLPKALKDRLFKLAGASNGQVNLHGRLFAQWMHHAFPQECPYPHEAGKTNPQTADEWMQKNGNDAHASEDELRKYVDSCSASGSAHAEASGDEAADLPWSDAEELLITSGSRSYVSWRTLVTAVLLAAAGVCAAVHQLIPMGAEQKKRLRVLQALLCLLLLGSATGFLNPAAFALPLVGGLVLLGGLSAASGTKQIAAKPEKCCV